MLWWVKHGAGNEGLHGDTHLQQQFILWNRPEQKKKYIYIYISLCFSFCPCSLPFPSSLLLSLPLSLLSLSLTCQPLHRPLCSYGDTHWSAGENRNLFVSQSLLAKSIDCLLSPATLSYFCYTYEIFNSSTARVIITCWRYHSSFQTPVNNCRLVDFAGWTDIVFHDSGKKSASSLVDEPCRWHGNKERILVLCCSVEL